MARRKKDFPHQGALFSEEPESIGPLTQPDPPWDPDLTRRLRVLLHAAPLLDLHRNDGIQESDRRHYDGLALALKVLDLIVTRTGLDQEVDSRVAASELSPLLGALDVMAGLEPASERHAAVVERVLGALRNDADSRRPFSAEYADFDPDTQRARLPGGESAAATSAAGMPAASRRRLEFSLVQDIFHPSGNVVMRLTNEAINLYLNALDQDIEDAQVAAEAVVQSQLARGKLAEAVQSARQARLQSLRLYDKIDRGLRETRRDVAAVDWSEELPQLITSSLEHLKGRQAVESAILEEASKRRASLDPADDRARAVVQIADLIEDCQVRNIELQQLLLGAHNVFLDEQERQAFRPRAKAEFPELASEVLEPLLAADSRAAHAALAVSVPMFLGPRPASVLALRDLVLWQLRPRREPSPDHAAIETIEAEASVAERPRFDPADRERSQALLDDLDAPVALSDLLDRLAASGEALSVQELVALQTLGLFAAEQPKAPVRVESLGTTLLARGFYGDDLALVPENGEPPCARPDGE